MNFKVFKTKEGKKKIPIEASKRFHEVPIGTTHVHVKAGKISFGFSSSIDGDKKTKKGRFIKIPSGAFAISFPKYCRDVAGHYYGEPQWAIFPSRVKTYFT
ncbi:MAG: hypothetical protein AAB696_01925 [Patescibacteria group bacterium]